MSTDTEFRGVSRTPLDHDSTSSNVETEAKRRKLRKGTHSCWECKRRKIKCTFTQPTDAICISCFRRGATCVNQEVPEGEISTTFRSPTKGLVKEVGRSSGNGSLQPSSTVVTPASISIAVTPEQSPTSHETSQEEPCLENNTFAGTSSLLTPASQFHAPDTPICRKYGHISIALHKAFPRQEDIDILYKAYRNDPMYFYQINMRPPAQVNHDAFILGKDSPQFLSPDAHPVLLARQLLIFAYLIQQGPIKNMEGLSEPPRCIMRRLAEAAITLVTTNEELHGTMESIECIILEAVYQLACGNLRRGWLAFRRALTIGQLMGIHRPNTPPLQNIDPATKFDPHFVWFRIVYMDRFLSMMLGFPQGTTDRSMVSDAAMAMDTPVLKLARTHAVIAARIMEQKERDPLLQDPIPFKEIDEELLKAAHSQETKFWLPPHTNLLHEEKTKCFSESVRFMNQLVHYNLVCQLHLPNLLRSSSDRRCRYSKMACINAAREILSRCITFSSLASFGNCCWIFAIPASMTLVLAHIDCYRHQELEHILAHQRLTDRVMIEQTLENMESLNETHDEAAGERGVNCLQWLLSIEAAAANGHGYTARSIHENEEVHEDDYTMRISIPYFGAIKITCAGVISKESLPTRWPPYLEKENCNETGYRASVYSNNRILSQSNGALSQNPSRLNMDSQRQHSPTDQQQPTTHQFPNAINDFDTQQQYLYPGLTAGKEDWTFQGVDNAFFDNLMMDTELPDAGANWLPNWQNEDIRGT